LRVQIQEIQWLALGAISLSSNWAQGCCGLKQVNEAKTSTKQLFSSWRRRPSSTLSPSDAGGQIIAERGCSAIAPRRSCNSSQGIWDGRHPVNPKTSNTEFVHRKACSNQRPDGRWQARALEGGEKESQCETEEKRSKTEVRIEGERCTEKTEECTSQITNRNQAARTTI